MHPANHVLIHASLSHGILFPISSTNRCKSTSAVLAFVLRHAQQDNPTYGIIGLFHLLPPALAWLWRLAAPRGHANPSIIDTNGMSSEGVGSYWPFATGRRVDQANLLLTQFRDNTRTRYILCPNQYVGAWEVGFMAEWIMREYMARRGTAEFTPEQIRPARSPLLGYALHQLQIEGRFVSRWFLQVNTQPEVGDAAYDQGADMLYHFFREQLLRFLGKDLDPLGTGNHRMLPG